MLRMRSVVPAEGVWRCHSNCPGALGGAWRLCNNSAKQMPNFFFFFRKARIRFSFVLVKTNTHVGLLWKQDGIQWTFGGSLGVEYILQGQMQRRDLFRKARKAAGRAAMPRECPAEMVMNSLDSLRLRRMRWHQRSGYGCKEIQGTWALGRLCFP